MKIPQVTRCDIKIIQTSITGQTVLCDIYLNDRLTWKGIQNKNYPIPSGSYRALTFKGYHPHTRLILTGVQHHSGVEIHEANVYSQLKGCTAIGKSNGGGYCTHSVDALKELISMVEQYNVCYVTLSNSLTDAANLAQV